MKKKLLLVSYTARWRTGSPTAQWKLANFLPHEILSFKSCFVLALKKGLPVQALAIWDNWSLKSAENCVIDFFLFFIRWAISELINFGKNLTCSNWWIAEGLVYFSYLKIIALKASSAFVEVWRGSWVRGVSSSCGMEQAFLWEHKGTPDECVSTATWMWALTSIPVWIFFLYNLDSHFHKPFSYLIILISSKTKNEVFVSVVETKQFHKPKCTQHLLCIILIVLTFSSLWVQF